MQPGDVDISVQYIWLVCLWTKSNMFYNKWQLDKCNGLTNRPQINLCCGLSTLICACRQNLLIWYLHSQQRTYLNHNISSLFMFIFIYYVRVSRLNETKMLIKRFLLAFFLVIFKRKLLYWNLLNSLGSFSTTDYYGLD